MAESLKLPPKTFGVTHWSSPLPGGVLEIANTRRAGVAGLGIKLWRAESCGFRTDPELVGTSRMPQY